MGWPQYIYLAIAFLGLGMHLAKHGEPKDERYNAVSYSIALAIILWVLNCGGFFG